jgi:SAM-dependent methyltransferase
MLLASIQLSTSWRNLALLRVWRYAASLAGLVCCQLGCRKCPRRDMTDHSKRPFYAEYAWAFDLLIDRPVRKECAAVAAWLVARGVLPGADLLDAGCGTGRYAAELARRGYVVEGIDLSADLVDVARRSIDEGRTSVSFAVGDIQALPAGRYDAILCRGVLNDFVDDEGREAVLETFGRALRPSGVLILDVREWETSAARKAREPIFKKSVDTDRGKLTFTSVTDIDRENRRLVLSERHTLVEDGQERSSDFQFVMRCWTRGELESGLAQSGFSPVAYFGAYDPTVHIGATDRLVAVARRSKTAP